MIWWMLMSPTWEASVFMGKNYSDNLHSIENTWKRSHFKADVRHIWKVDSGTIRWDFWSLKSVGQIFHGNKYLWSMMKKEISLSHAKVHVVTDSVLCLGKVNQNPTSNTVWEQQLDWFKDSSQYRTVDTIDGESMEFEWNIFPGFTTLQLVDEVQKFMNKMSDPAQLQGRIIFMSLFIDIVWWIKDNEQECIAYSTLVFFAKRFQAGRWSFLGLGSETKWYSTYNERPRGEWDRVAKLRMVKFRESGHPVFRVTSPLSRGTLKGKRGGKLSVHFCADRDAIGTVFHTIISVNQLSIYGAVSDLCECKSCPVRAERPVLAGQSDPLFAPASLLMTTSTPSTEVPPQEDLLQKYERVERLSQQNRVIKICTDAGFLTIVEIGQYFMTKHTDEFFQFAEPVTRREYTLARDEKSSDPKGWIRGHTKIGPLLEVTTSYLQGKYGVEIRTESVNKGNSHSCVGISHGLNKLVTDLIDKEYDDNEQETSETKTEIFALKMEVFAFASRSKAKAKPRRPTSACSSSRTVPIRERTWIDIEPGAQFDRAYPVAKRLNSLLRHGQFTSRRRWCDRILESKRWSSVPIWALSTLVWWYVEERWQEAEATRKGFNNVLPRQDKKFFTSELFKVIQDAIPLVLHCRTMC